MDEIVHEKGAKVPSILVYPDKFSQQVVVVTGAGAGIRRETTILFARQGAHVIGFDTDELKLQETQLLIQKFTTKIDIKVCDISDEVHVNESINRTVQQYGKIDILVNLAGIYPLHSFREYPSEAFHQVIATNLIGTFLLTRAVMPHMDKAGYGRIIHTISSTFNGPQPGLAAYMASKGGTLGLVRSAAVEAGPGITVNAVMPGLITTDRVMALEHVDMMFEGIVKRQSVKRRGHPLDVAHAICFIASPEASFFQWSDLQL